MDITRYEEARLRLPSIEDASLRPRIGGTVRSRAGLLVVALVLVVTAVAAGYGITGVPVVHGSATAAERPLGANAVHGVWNVTEQSTRPIGGQWSRGTAPYLSQYIFTEKHYSYMFAPGAGPRRLFLGDPNQATDAEKIAAFDSFVASSGTYLLSDSALTLNAILHKNPNEMTGEPLIYNVEFDNKAVVLTIVDPPFAPGRERRTVLTRLE
jgi:hypothetical protein